VVEQAERQQEDHHDHQVGAGAHLVVVVVFLLALSLLNHRGIAESTAVTVFCTVTSVAGLGILVLAGASRWGSVRLLERGVTQGAAALTGAAPVESGLFAAIVSGAALAFYAFIGFEDMCNVAEEVVRPARNLPRAILVSLATATLVYVAVAITAVSSGSMTELAASSTPLMLVSERLLPSWPSAWLAVVALLATTNTALFNLIMASRMLYGMARQGWIPAAFGAVHPKRQTPSLGVAMAFLLAAGFALTGALEVLAGATNVVILGAFFAVNASLLALQWRGRRRRKREAEDGPRTTVRDVIEDASPADRDRPFEVPWLVPALGLVATAAMASQLTLGAYLRAAGLVAVGAALYALEQLRRAHAREKAKGNWRR